MGLRGQKCASLVALRDLIASEEVVSSIKPKKPQLTLLPKITVSAVSRKNRQCGRIMGGAGRLEEKIRLLCAKGRLGETPNGYGNLRRLLLRCRKVQSPIDVKLRSKAWPLCSLLRAEDVAMDKDSSGSDEKPSTTLPGTVEKIIKSPDPTAPEKAQITVEVAEELYREVRIDNILKDKNGEAVALKKGSKVDVIIEADPKDIIKKNE